jgi:hypothetical protein
VAVPEQVLALVAVVPVLLALLLLLLQVVAARELHLLLVPPLLEVLRVPAQLRVVARPPVVDLAEEAVEPHRSFSAAMAGISP